MKTLLRILLVIFTIILVTFISFPVIAGEAKTGGLIVLKTGKGYNGNIADESIKILTSLGDKIINSKEIISISQGKSQMRLLLTENRILWGKIVNNLKVNTNEGNLTINPEDLIYFNKILTTPANEIGKVDISNDNVQTFAKKKPSDKINVWLLTDYRENKVFTLSNPIYQRVIEDPRKPVEISIDFLKHTDITEQTLIIYRLKGSMKGGGTFDSQSYDRTSISLKKEENVNLKLNLTFLRGPGSETLEGEGYVDVFVVPREQFAAPPAIMNFYNQQHPIYNTLSNVLRLPFTIK
jgi:hypothetical protein